MEKNNYSQLELFTQTGIATPKTGHPARFLTYIRGYEKTILIIIGFIITGVISFSLGVEKQKNAVILNTNSRIDIAIKKPSSASHPIVNPKPYQPDTDDNQQYTIQVATFQTENYAQKEAQDLRKKGFTCLILSKGAYSIVCVGNFSNKEVALSLLSQLKKRYRDCFLRRL